MSCMVAKFAFVAVSFLVQEFTALHVHSESFSQDPSAPNDQFTKSIIALSRANSTLLDYFYGGDGGYGNKDEIKTHYHFRTKSCNQGAQRGGSSYAGDIVYRKKQNIGEPCLWDNMAPMKLVAVISLARKLGVTHIIESGRMGGMSSFIYDLQGFQTVSIEMLPVGDVKHDLHELSPAITLIDGDGMKMVPSALDAVGLNAKVGVILDGPKEEMALQLTKQIYKRGSVAFVALDDTQHLKSGLEALQEASVFHTDDAQFRAHFPMNKDALVAKDVSTKVNHFSETDRMSLVILQDKLSLL